MPNPDMQQQGERIRAWAASRAHLFSAAEDYLCGVEDALAQLQRFEAADGVPDAPESPGDGAPRARPAPRGIEQHLSAVERLRLQASEIAAASPDPDVAAALLRRAAGDDPALLLAAHRADRRRRSEARGEGSLLLAAARGTVEPARVHGHRVTFHEGADRLVDEIVGFVDPALAGSEGVGMVVATAGRRRQVEARLHGRGRHLARLRGQGRYVALDAAELLGELVHDGRPDRRRFREVVRPRLEVAAAAGPVRVYGEMVALLCERREAVQAVELEELWNELAEEIPFALLCGYPMTVFDDVRDAEALRHVCRQHSEVVPAAG